MLISPSRVVFVVITLSLPVCVVKDVTRSIEM